jgi:hypothetical protein
MVYRHYSSLVPAAAGGGTYYQNAARAAIEVPLSKVTLDRGLYEVCLASTADDFDDIACCVEFEVL